MKKYYLIAGLVLLAASPAFAQVKIGAAGAPDGSAMLEVTAGAANNKGILPPRITTAQRNAITTPATGLMIYNTTANEMQVNTGTPASPTWTAATTAPGWNTNGNTGTTPATNFIGTTDNQPLTIRTNNTEKVRVTAPGSVGVGTTTPLSKLHVVDTGNAAIIVASSTNEKMSFNLGNGHHGMSRNLTEAGGGANDVALYTTSGSPSSPASIHLGVRATVADTLDLNQFVLKNTGYVGIGTNTPITKLHVVDTGDADIRVTSATANTGRMRVTLGNQLHGIVRNLTNSGGGPNEVALYTSTGPSSPGSLYLVASPTATDSLNLTQFALKNTGNIGIGIKDPGTRLHVNSGSLRVSNSTNPGNPAIQVINDGGGSTNSDNIVIQSYGASTLPSIGTFASRGTLAAPANSQAGDNMGNFYTGARVNGLQTTINQIGHIYLGDGTNSKSRMTFSTSNTLAMQIDSNQNVRIFGNANLDGGVFVRVDDNIAYSNGSLHTWNTVNSGLGETEFINYRGSGGGGFRFFNVTQSDTASSANDIAAINPLGAYNQLSDMRLKTNVNTINGGLEKVMALHPVSYDFHTGKTLKDGVVTFTKNDVVVPSIGFLAQELAKVVPEAVEVPKDPANELYKVSYASIVPVLTKAIQEQQAQIEALKAKNEQLEAVHKVTAQLIERVKQMEQMMGIKEIEGTSKVAGQ
jgi:hypothetical protein